MTNKNLTFLLAAFIFIILRATESVALSFNHVNCKSNKTFTTNSTFQINLNTLLSSLASNATGDTRFYNATVGSGRNTSDTVYGLFMCRGDVPFQLCSECVSFATRKLTSSCPLANEAVIWYNECLLRYADRFFFSTMEEWPRYPLKNPLGDPGLLRSRRFYTTLVSILNYLIDEAAQALRRSGSQFAFKQGDASSNTTLYGLAQCTPDLTADYCKRCVRDAIAEITTSCCEGRIGENVMFPSCIVRYEIYPFVYKQSGTPTVANGQ